ncbi:MAG TPA: glycosyltransferase family 4 protein [Methanothrix sp.]|nr:glycosyltransferase family 4 protein [Methanothrix sp.]
MDMKALKDCNLLVVSERYPHIKDPMSSSFVKNQVDCLRDYVKKVYVISLAPYVPGFLSRFAFMEGRGRWDGYAEDYKYDNVEVYFARPWALPFDFSRRRRGDEGLRSARRVIEKNKLEYDLIHAHFTYSAGYVGAKLKESSGKGLILTVHEDRNWLMNEIASKDEKLLFTWRSCDRIIRVNKADLDMFKAINIDPSRLVHIPNGFSSSQFHSISKKEAREKLNIPEDKPVLLNLAALEPYKGQEYLIRAMKTVTERQKDAVLYIVGKGSLRGYLQSLIDECGLQEQVILAGGDKPPEEIALWMNSCDIFVLPSISESFGIVQLEAMACGKPVVATRNGGSEEIIVDDGLGMLVEPANSNALTEALLRALERDWDSMEIMDYASGFSWESIAEKIAGVYGEVICRVC